MKFILQVGKQTTIGFVLLFAMLHAGSGISKADDQQCTATLQGAVTDLFACLRGVPSKFAVKKMAEWMDLYERFNKECYDYEGNVIRDYKCDFLKLNRETVYEDVPQNTRISLDFIGECEEKFKEIYSKAKLNCLGFSQDRANLNGLYCSATKTASYSCNSSCQRPPNNATDLECIRKCESLFTPPVGCNPETIPFKSAPSSPDNPKMTRLTKKIIFSCEAEVSPIIEPICARCEFASDPEGCRADCAALRKRLMAACEGRNSVPPNPVSSDGNPGIPRPNRVQRTSTNSSKRNLGSGVPSNDGRSAVSNSRSKGGTDTATSSSGIQSPAKRRSDLDRFDLGPAGMTPQQTSPNDRGNRAIIFQRSQTPSSTFASPPGVRTQTPTSTFASPPGVRTQTPTSTFASPPGVQRQP